MALFSGCNSTDQTEYQAYFEQSKAKERNSEVSDATSCPFVCYSTNERTSLLCNFYRKLGPALAGALAACTSAVSAASSALMRASTEDVDDAGRAGVTAPISLERFLSTPPFFLQSDGAASPSAVGEGQRAAQLSLKKFQKRKRSPHPLQGEATAVKNEDAIIEAIGRAGRVAALVALLEGATATCAAVPGALDVSVHAGRRLVDSTRPGKGWRQSTVPLLAMGKSGKLQAEVLYAPLPR